MKTNLPKCKGKLQKLTSELTLKLLRREITPWKTQRKRRSQHGLKNLRVRRREYPSLNQSQRQRQKVHQSQKQMVRKHHYHQTYHPLKKYPHQNLFQRNHL
uniref:Uncharacterized protein n=1 Tax=Cacopsylla melanoneura TaxID=428564 RepID=A0A8D8TSX2_9HEMI